MSHTKKPDAGSPDPPPCNEQVISLCERRRRHSMRRRTDELIHSLRAVHAQAIAEHNRAIAHAGLSVLTELCRTLGVCLDVVDPTRRAALLTPAALYGDARGRIYGKRALQQEITEALRHDRDAAALFRALSTARPGAWKVQIRRDLPTDLATPLISSEADDCFEIGAVIVESGAPAPSGGLFSGWKICFQDTPFIVFGHRLDSHRESALHKLFTDHRNPDDLALLRALVDPDNAHRRAANPLLSNLTRLNARRLTSRRGLLLAIRRTLWRHFAEAESGLTIHAHIAALIDDEDTRQAFFDEVRRFRSQILLKSDGLPPGEPPISLDEILSPFSLTESQGFSQRLDLLRLPTRLLLLDPDLLATASLQADAPIEDTLLSLAGNHDAPATRAIECAWLTFRVEQNLVATYGIAPGIPADDRSGTISFARRSVVLPNLRTLFDPRFLMHPLTDLDLGAHHLHRLKAGKPDALTLDDIGPDERQLARLSTVNHDTCNALRRALLDFAATWRWRRSGLPLPL